MLYREGHADKDMKKKVLLCPKACFDRFIQSVVSYLQRMENGMGYGGQAMFVGP